MKSRLGDLSGKVTWSAADITGFDSREKYDIRHGRAVFHFLSSKAFLFDIIIVYRYYKQISMNDINESMLRDIHLAFIKMHILYHASKEEIFGIGLIEELGRHGYKLSPGTLYPTLAKMQEAGLLTCESRVVRHKQRKYYKITRSGMALLNEVKVKLKELYDEVAKGK